MPYAHFFSHLQFEGELTKLVDKNDTDLFIDVCLGNAKLASTSTIRNAFLYPTWNESYKIDICHLADQLRFNIYHKDNTITEYIGSVEIETLRLKSGEIIDKPCKILNKNGKTNGTLKIYTEFMCVT